MEEKKAGYEKQTSFTRREFLKVAAAAFGGGLLTCGALGLAANQQPAIPYLSLTLGEETMNNSILVMYASQCGSTGEVAQAVGEELAAAGAKVNVCRVQDVKSLSGYRAVVLGSAARMGKLLPEAQKCVEKFRQDLQSRPVAYFTTGVTMIEDTPANRAQAEGYLAPLVQIKTPVSQGLFAGKVEHSKLELIWRVALSFVKEGQMAEADHRDWEKIRAWARSLDLS